MGTHEIKMKLQVNYKGNPLLEVSVQRIDSVAVYINDSCYTHHYHYHRISRYFLPNIITSVVVPYFSTNIYIITKLSPIIIGIRTPYQSIEIFINYYYYILSKPNHYCFQVSVFFLYWEERERSI